MTERLTGSSIFRRVALCALGVFCVSFGIAVTASSDLGTSPISSVAWVACRVSQVSSSIPTLTFGTTSFILNVVFFLTQMAILKREFGRIQFLQLPCVFVFSVLIDISMWICGFLPPANYYGRVAMVFAGCAIVALGLAFEFAAEILYLPGDGMVKALTTVFKSKPGATKIAFDVFLTLSSVALSYALIRQCVGVREGTLISMFAVGFFLKLYQPIVEKLRKFAR